MTPTRAPPSGMFSAKRASAVGAGELVDDGQAQARALAGARRVGPVEALEDPRQGRRRDAGTVVAHGQHDRLTRQRNHLHPHVTARPGRGRQGVAHEVAEDALHGHAIAGQRQGHGLGGGGHLLAVGGGARGEPLGGLARQQAAIELFELQRPDARLEVRQSAQVRDHAIEPRGLVGDGGRRPARLITAGGAVLERLGEPADDRQRRAQVVAQAGQHVGLGASGVLHLGGHRVEGEARVPHLLRAVGGQRRRQAALADVAGRHGEALERARHLPRQERGQGDAHDQRGEGREEQAAHQVTQGLRGGRVGVGQDERAGPARGGVGEQGGRDVLVGLAAEAVRAVGDVAAALRAGDEELAGRDVAAGVEDLAVVVGQEDAHVAALGERGEGGDHLAGRGAGHEAQADLHDEGHQRFGQGRLLRLLIEVAQDHEQGPADADEEGQAEQREGRQDAGPQRADHVAATAGSGSRAGGTSR